MVLWFQYSPVQTSKIPDQNSNSNKARLDSSVVYAYTWSADGCGFDPRVCGDWSLNRIYGHSVTTADSIRAFISYWRNDVDLLLVNRLGSLPRNSVVRLTDRLDRTIVVDWDVKPQIKQTNKQTIKQEILFRVLSFYLFQNTIYNFFFDIHINKV